MRERDGERESVMNTYTFTDIYTHIHILTLSSLEHNSNLNTLKDVVCYTLTGREFHSVVVDKIKDFRRSSVLQFSF